MSAANYKRTITKGYDSAIENTLSFFLLWTRILLYI